MKIMVVISGFRGLIGACLLTQDVRIVKDDNMAFATSFEVLLGLRVGQLAGELNVDELDRKVCVGGLNGLVLVGGAVDFLHVQAGGVVGDHF